MMTETFYNLGPGWAGGKDPSEMNEAERLIGMLDSLVRFADFSARAGERQSELYAQVAAAIQKAHQLLDGYISGHVRGNIVALYSEAVPMDMREAIENEFNREHSTPDFSDKALPLIALMDQKFNEICKVEEPAYDPSDERLHGISEAFQNGYGKWKDGHENKT